MGGRVMAPAVIGVPAVGPQKEKNGQPRTTTPPAPPKKLAGKGNSAAPQKAALGSPLREPGSPGTVPMIVYREACPDRDEFRHERDAARLATEAATRLKEELDTVKRQRDDLQAKLVEVERQGATTEARLEVLQRSKGLKHIESWPGAASPSQSGVPVAPPATYSAQSMQFLASGLLEYAHLATRLMADAKSSCQQLQTIAGLARTTTMPDLSVDSLPKPEAEVSTRLQNANRRGRMWWWLLSSLAGSHTPWLAVWVLSLEPRLCGSRWTPTTWFVYIEYMYGIYCF